MPRTKVGRLILAAAVGLSVADVVRAQPPSAVATPVVAPDPASMLQVPDDMAVRLRRARQDRAELGAQLREARRERAVPVPPTLEIEVLDPNADPLGNPAVIPTTIGGRTIIDIPPVVLVHRYYYTGDRSFQGPLIPGGPSIIVLSHPQTGERLYVQTQLLPGAPRVTYTRSTVEYDYGPQAIILKFGCKGNPTVIYRQGTPLLTRIRDASEQRHERLERTFRRTGIPDAAAQVRSGAQNVAETTADRVRDVGRLVATPVVRLVQSTPLGNAFTTTPEQRALRERDDLARRASAEATRLGADIPTNR